MSSEARNHGFVPGLITGMIIVCIITLIASNLAEEHRGAVISISKYQKIRNFEKEHEVALTMDSQGQTWLWVPKIQKSVIINVEGDVIF